MREKFLCGSLTAAIVLFAHLVGAQEVSVRRVGIILQGGPWYAIVDGLRDGLRKLEFVEGKHFVLDIRDTGGDLAAVEAAARNLEQRNVDLIYTVATSVSLRAKGSTERVPIVFVAGTDPVAVGLVDSIPRPGGRLTGVHFPVTFGTGKRFELFREIVPHLHRVVTFYNPSNRAALEGAREAREAAQNLGLELLERHVASVEELQKVLQAFKSGEADGYIAVADAMIDSQGQSIIEMANANRLPTMVYNQDLVAKGGLASYSPDYQEAGRVSAKYVRRILEGTIPTDLPVEQIDRLVFAINLKTAKQIGLAISEAILIRADNVIE